MAISTKGGGEESGLMPRRERRLRPDLRWRTDQGKRGGKRQLLSEKACRRSVPVKGKGKKEEQLRRRIGFSISSSPPGIYSSKKNGRGMRTLPSPSKLKRITSLLPPALNGGKKKKVKGRYVKNQRNHSFIL